jgi:acetolactate synthase I/III small subunit
MKDQSRVQLTIRLLVEDKPGVLIRVAGIVTAKGENIDMLLAEPDSPGLSRITLVARLEPRYCHRVVNAMNRLVQVLEAAGIIDANLC